MYPLRIFFLFSVTLFFWMANLEASFTGDADSIYQARTDQNKAIAAGDIEKVASFWTDDITLRRGLGSFLQGKEDYSASFDTASKETPLIYLREPDLIEVSSCFPLAYESGTWSARQDGIDLISGRYSAQWVKREEVWLIRSEIFVALTCSNEAGSWPVLP